MNDELQIIKSKNMQITIPNSQEWKGVTIKFDPRIWEIDISTCFNGLIILNNIECDEIQHGSPNGA